MPSPHVAEHCAGDQAEALGPGEAGAYWGTLPPPSVRARGLSQPSLTPFSSRPWLAVVACQGIRVPEALGTGAGPGRPQPPSHRAAWQ